MAQRKNFKGDLKYFNKAHSQGASECWGLFFGGNLKDGIGMADRIKQGKELANKAIKK